MTALILLPRLADVLRRSVGLAQTPARRQNIIADENKRADLTAPMFSAHSFAFIGCSDLYVGDRRHSAR